MKILVPSEVCDELKMCAALREAAGSIPGVTLVPYAEDRPPGDGWQEADGVLRWVAGKAYAGLVEDGPKVRWLHTASAGVDHVLTPAIKARMTAGGLIVTDSGPAFEIAIAEFVLAWMLLTARRLPELIAQQRERRWEPLVQAELSGQTVGIIGLGPIGLGVAARARAFGMTTLGLRRTPGPAPNVDAVLSGPLGLSHLLRASDFVVLAAALTAETCPHRPGAACRHETVGPTYQHCVGRTHRRAGAD